MPPAPCSSGSTTIPASSSAWLSASFRNDAAQAATPSSSAGGWSANTWSATKPRNIVCIPLSGSQTPMHPQVSPW